MIEASNLQLGDNSSQAPYTSHTEIEGALWFGLIHRDHLVYQVVVACVGKQV